MRRRFVWHRGAWVDVTDAKRPPRKTPYLIRDCMDALRHPATGEVMDSKSAFRAATRAAGMVELGNDAPTTVAPAPPPPVAEDIAQAWSMVEQGYTPPPCEVAGTLDGEAIQTQVYT